MKCPYCGEEAVLRNSSWVYKNGNDEDKVYVCKNYPECDSYVGCHKGSIRPKGSLANSELRSYRIKAHKELSSMQKRSGLSRRKTYNWLSSLLNVDMSNCHIGLFNKDMCQSVIDTCRAF